MHLCSMDGYNVYSVLAYRLKPMNSCLFILVVEFKIVMMVECSIIQAYKVTLFSHSFCIMINHFTCIMCTGKIYSQATYCWYIFVI